MAEVEIKNSGTVTQRHNETATQQPALHSSLATAELPNLTAKSPSKKNSFLQESDISEIKKQTADVYRRLERLIENSNNASQSMQNELERVTPSSYNYNPFSSTFWTPKTTINAIKASITTEDKRVELIQDTLNKIDKLLISISKAEEMLVIMPASRERVELQERLDIAYRKLPVKFDATNSQIDLIGSDGGILSSKNEEILRLQALANSNFDKGDAQLGTTITVMEGAEKAGMVASLLTPAGAGKTVVVQGSKTFFKTAAKQGLKAGFKERNAIIATGLKNTATEHAKKSLGRRMLGESATVLRNGVAYSTTVATGKAVEDAIVYNNKSAGKAISDAGAEIREGAIHSLGWAAFPVANGLLGGGGKLASNLLSEGWKKALGSFFEGNTLGKIISGGTKLFVDLEVGIRGAVATESIADKILPSGQTDPLVEQAKEDAKFKVDKDGYFELDDNGDRIEKSGFEKFNEKYGAISYTTQIGNDLFYRPILNSVKEVLPAVTGTIQVNKLRAIEFSDGKEVGVNRNSENVIVFKDSNEFEAMIAVENVYKASDGSLLVVGRSFDDGGKQEEYLIKIDSNRKDFKITKGTADKAELGKEIDKTKLLCIKLANGESQFVLNNE